MCTLKTCQKYNRGLRLIASLLDFSGCFSSTFYGIDPPPEAFELEMTEKKRKRDEEKLEGQPSKRIAMETPSQTIKVSTVEDSDGLAPVLGQ